MTRTDPTSPVLIATGAYTSPGRGRGRGIGMWSLDVEQAALAPLGSLDLEDPSFLCWSADGRLLHVVHETSPTRVSTVRVSDDGSSLELLGTLELEGSGGCHVGLGRLDGTLIVTDYGSGQVEVVGLDADGAPDRIIDVCDHRGYRPPRESHPHQSTLMPGCDLIGISDLGLDRVYLYRQGPSGEIDLAGEMTAPRGSGPRHIAPDHESRNVYVACEHSGQIVDFARGRKAPGQSAPSYPAGPPVAATGREGTDHPSHIEISSHENHLFIANRGPDTLAAFSLVMTRPELASEIEVGAHPRHFTRVGDLVLVAAQEGDRIDLIRWDGERLSVAADPVVAPSATCIAPRP